MLKAWTQITFPNTCCGYSLLLYFGDRILMTERKLADLMFERANTNDPASGFGWQPQEGIQHKFNCSSVPWGPCSSMKFSKAFHICHQIDLLCFPCVMMELLSLTRSVVPSPLHSVRKKEREAVAFPSHGKLYRNGRITLEMSQGCSPLAAFSFP